MAIAWHKPTFLFRDDFRRCTDSEVYPLNLMLFAGLPETVRSLLPRDCGRSVGGMSASGVSPVQGDWGELSQ